MAVVGQKSFYSRVCVQIEPFRKTPLKVNVLQKVDKCFIFSFKGYWILISLSVQRKCSFLKYWMRSGPVNHPMYTNDLLTHKVKRWSTEHMSTC